MDFWKSDFQPGDTTSVLAGIQEFVDSPNNSLEYSSDSIVSDQTDIPKIPTTPKSALLAKKRLQAYYKVKVGNINEEKKETNAVDKAVKPSYKKARKTYPDEAAKAVIRDIEILKRAGYGFAPSGPSVALPADIVIPTDPIVPISILQVHGNSPTVAAASDVEEENLFKKREIRCKNIRKSDTYRGRSKSPRNKHEGRNSREKDKKEYPKNWNEYKDMGLNPDKHALLKSKLWRKSRDRKFDFQRYFDLQLPSVPIEIYKGLSRNGESALVPFPYLRCTATKPQIIYSTNQHIKTPGYLSRKQLFTLIPKERRLLIEKLWKFSKCQVEDKAIALRKWYPKSWRKTDNSEAKLLENSVGLSFLQGYSDEEEAPEVNHRESVVLVEENVDFGEKKNDDEFDFPIELPPEKEELTPSGTPKAAPANLEENSLNEIKTLHENNENPKTPPIQDKEEGEVESEEERIHEENFEDIGTDEYEKTKQELEKLEAVLKSSTAYLENDIITSIPTEVKKPDKKRHKKVSSSVKIRNKKPKKKTKKKRQRKEKNPDPSDCQESQVEDSKKKKQKKDKRSLKSKLDSEKKRKEKKKKSKKKKAEISVESDEELAVESELEILVKKKKKKKKKRLGENIKKRTTSGDSVTKPSERKNSVDMVQEEYEDEFKFFADRFDAESELKGKTRHKTKTNISLEELTVLPKVEEKIQKRKAKWESSESDGLFSPETAKKKMEQEDAKKKIEKEDAKKSKDNEETAIKNEVKVDLLKMNEEYLREQKRKEETAATAIAKDDAKKDEPSIEEIKKPLKEVTQPIKEPDNQPPKVIDLDKFDIEVDKDISEIKLPDEPKTTTKTTKKLDDELDLEQIRAKRKRHRSTKAMTLTDKKSKHSDSTELAVQELLSLEDIKKEKDSTEEKKNERSNSWESDEESLAIQSKSFDLEIPLNIKSFSRREMKIEKDVFDVEEPPKQPNRYKTRKKVDAFMDFPVKTKRRNDRECIDLESFTKKSRWDIPSCTSTPLVKVEKSDEIIIDLDASSLENEYEEFLKAVTSTNDSFSNSDPLVNFQSKKNCDKTEELTPRSPPDIPLPLVVQEQIKPVPVPSPKLEAVIDLTKPLINLSLSANVTQNITLSLATSVPSISSPITSCIDISKTSVEISAPDTLVSMNNIPLEMPEVKVNHDISNSEDQSASKLIFTSLTLPSKKRLLDSSKLNLDDSDPDEQALMEEIKKKKLEALIADNERETLDEPAIKAPEVTVEAEPKSLITKVSQEDVSPLKKHTEASPKRNKKEPSPPSRRGLRRREASPRKRLSPRRKSPPKRRSPLRRRPPSPRRRRNSGSPRRRRSRSPRRKRISPPKSRQSPSKRNRSLSPRNKRSPLTKESRSDTTISQRKSSGRPRTPVNQRETSPLKRSVADSTISDDQLLQTDDYVDAKQKEADTEYSPRRMPLDVRISQVLGYDEISPNPPNPYQTEVFQLQQHCQYSNIQSQVTVPTARAPQSTYKQVGNMLQIVPLTDNLPLIPEPQEFAQIGMISPQFQQNFEQFIPSPRKPPVEIKQKILQVGNMLQIVPTEIVPSDLLPVPPPVETEIKIEQADESWFETSIVSPSDKPSAEASMLLKIAERRTERENRRVEREKRKKEKEKRRKEKEKARQAKLKIRTENMIKRALELEEEEEDAFSDTLVDQPAQWPPLPTIIVHSMLKEAGKSILINSRTRCLDDSFREERKMKVVQFADGIRPGEGTSPSAGEDLSSPPPPKRKLPKEKRYKKIQFSKKGGKKKVKVKVIKKQPSPMTPIDESDSDENLPPPSPPPGSPPPHIFPPRIKVSPVNNVPAAYLASIIQSAQQQPPQQQQQTAYQSSLYRPPINLLMAPPPPQMYLAESHLSSVLPHVQSPLGATGLSPQTHYHPGLAAPPPPPALPNSTGHGRHYSR